MKRKKLITWILKEKEGTQLLLCAHLGKKVILLTATEEDWKNWESMLTSITVAQQVSVLM